MDRSGSAFIDVKTGKRFDPNEAQPSTTTTRRVTAGYMNAHFRDRRAQTRMGATWWLDPLPTSILCASPSP
jgi:hypothetical protein